MEPGSFRQGQTPKAAISIQVVVGVAESPLRPVSGRGLEGYSSCTLVRTRRFCTCRGAQRTHAPKNRCESTSRIGDPSAADRWGVDYSVTMRPEVPGSG